MFDKLHVQRARVRVPIRIPLHNNNGHCYQRTILLHDNSINDLDASTRWPTEFKLLPRYLPESALAVEDECPQSSSLDHEFPLRSSNRGRSSSPLQPPL